MGAVSPTTVSSFHAERADAERVCVAGAKAALRKKRRRKEMRKKMRRKVGKIKQKENYFWIGMPLIRNNCVR